MERLDIGLDRFLGIKRRAVAEPTGAIPIPVMAIHSINDPQVSVDAEASYRVLARTAGNSDRLVQAYTDENEHTGQSAPETRAIDVPRVPRKFACFVGKGIRAGSLTRKTPAPHLSARLTPACRPSSVSASAPITRRGLRAELNRSAREFSMCREGVGLAATCRALSRDVWSAFASDRQSSKGTDTKTGPLGAAMAKCTALAITAGTEAGSGASKLHFTKGRGDTMAPRLAAPPGSTAPEIAARSRSLVHPSGIEGLIFGSWAALSGERLSCVGPAEGPGHGGVEIGAELLDPGLQHLLAGEVAAADELSHQNGKPDFDLIEP
jgi:hypothetical protein